MNDKIIQLLQNELTQYRGNQLTKVLQLLGTIKKCAVFFTVLAAIGIAAAIIVPFCL